VEFLGGSWKNRSEGLHGKLVVAVRNFGKHHLQSGFTARKMEVNPNLSTKTSLMRRYAK